MYAPEMEACASNLSHCVIVASTDATQSTDKWPAVHTQSRLGKSTMIHIEQICSLVVGAELHTDLGNNKGTQDYYQTYYTMHESQGKFQEFLMEGCKHFLSRKAAVPRCPHIGILSLQK